MIPGFRDDGYLPQGVHIATEAEVTFRFGTISRALEPALELEQMLLSRRPEEIFAAEDSRDWDDWVEFFSRTRELDGRRKRLVEVRL
jgi:hypothetical protein